MRPSRFTDEQILGALRRVEEGTPAAQMCRTLGITQTTFYRWRSRFGPAALGDSRELRTLREENMRLKQIVADLLLDRQGQGTAGRRKK